jgi:hypothetical protein
MAGAKGSCGACGHFRNDIAYLEAAIPGLASLSSGAASVRADDGLCQLRDRYLSARAWCADFAAAQSVSSLDVLALPSATNATNCDADRLRVPRPERQSPRIVEL